MYSFYIASHGIRNMSIVEVSGRMCLGMVGSGRKVGNGDPSFGLGSGEVGKAIVRSPMTGGKIVRYLVHMLLYLHGSGMQNLSCKQKS